MAQALAGGIARDIPEAHFFICDPSKDAIQQFQLVSERVQVCPSNEELCRESEIVFLAVKPQQLLSAFPEPLSWDSPPLFLSILAGTTIQQLETTLGCERVIRVMPNTPCLIGQGVLATAARKQVAETDRRLANEVLQAVGMVLPIDESKMDIITALSGSGPAYVYRLIEIMVERGMEAGLDETTCLDVVTATVIGAGEMVRQTNSDPASLRAAVTSPGGTTQADTPENELKRCLEHLALAS